MSEFLSENSDFSDEIFNIFEQACFRNEFKAYVDSNGPAQHVHLHMLIWVFAVGSVTH